GAVIVLDADPIAVPGGRARADDRAVHDRPDRRADRSGDIKTGVHRAPAHFLPGGQGAFGGLDDGTGRGRGTRPGRGWSGGCGLGVGCFVRFGALRVVLDGRGQLVIEVGNWLVLGNRENLRGSLCHRGRQRGSIAGQLVVDMCRLCGHRDVGLRLQGRSGRTTDTRGRNGASSHSSEGDASCDRSRGGHLAVFSDGRSLVSAVHVSSLGSGDARAATNRVIFVIKA